MNLTLNNLIQLSAFAQVRATLDIGHLATVIIVIAALIGIVLVALRAFGINIPREVWLIAGIVVVAFVAIIAVRFLLSL